MSNDTDWVADVRRWCLSSRQAAVASAVPGADIRADVRDDMPEIGYEAAHPALQARHWPDAPPCAAADRT